MFEDSTFESTGRIRTRSRRWMIAAFAFNGSILLAMVLIPLLYPEALPRVAAAILMLAPPPQRTPAPMPQTVHVTHVSTGMMDDQLIAPRRIQPHIYMATAPEPPDLDTAATLDSGSGTQGSGLGSFRGQGSQPVVREAAPTRARISSGVMNGLLVRQAVPAYPALAREMGLEGTVVLQATISKTGTIENLRVVAGPALLQQAALDAVSTWLYRPYLLNDQPVEVETTINVVFTLH
ncbi:MAG: energy transducer TonB [Terracidiphilus sp.]